MKPPIPNHQFPSVDFTPTGRIFYYHGAHAIMIETGHRLNNLVKMFSQNKLGNIDALLYPWSYVIARKGRILQLRKISSSKAKVNRNLTLSL
jgi:hypothetical protein